MAMADRPVGWSVLDHQQQAAVAALVAAELVAQRLECGDDPIGVDAGHQADDDIQDRLGGKSG